MAHCEACGATITPTAPTCKVCDRDNTEHLAKLGLVDPPEVPPEASDAEPDEPEAAEPWAPFSPAPRIPAPLKAARPHPDRFKPVAGIVITAPGTMPPAALDLEGFDKDRTPSWVYRMVLILMLAAAGVSAMFYDAPAPLFGPGWRLSFTITLVVSLLVALIVAFRLGRKEEYGRRSAEFARRRREGTVRAMREAAQGFVSASKGIAQSGVNFREGFEGDKDPNWIVKFIRWIIRTITRTILGFVSLVRWVFSLGLKIWILAVRIGWWLYRGIVEPVLTLAFRIVRWALKVTYRVARWALNVAWRIFYWLMRRFPFKYVTRQLEEPMRFHVHPKVLVTNVIVSDALGAPVKEPVRQRAEPFVREYRLERETAKAQRLFAKQDEYDQQRPLWLTIPTPEERRERANERKRQKAEAKAAEEQAKLDAKEAEKQAKLAAKEERKKAKEEGRLDELKEQKKAEKLAAKGKDAPKPGKADKADKEAEKEAKRKAKEEAKAEKAAAKKPSRKERKAEKKQAAAEEKEAKKRAKEEAKAEKKAAKQDKKKSKGDGDDEDEPQGAQSAP